MKEKVGYQIGIASQLPLNESAIMNMIISALEWQEMYGPIIIFVDEPFYRFLFRTKIESIYHDVIPIPVEVNMDEAIEYANKMFPVEIYPIENINAKQMDRDAINEYMKTIPKEISDNWLGMLMNEEMILSLSQLNSN
jgi:hypothetical protein